MTVIITDEFTLRPLAVVDLEGFFETMQDSDTKKALNDVPADIEEAENEIQKMLKKVSDGFSEIFTIEVGGKYAGNVTLEYQGYKPCDEGRLHIFIHPDFRGKGLATKTLKKVIEYGFNERKFVRIFAQCKASNIAIMKLNQKLGLKVVKEHINENGVKKVLWVIDA
ncbi:MAG: GNAT family N-acetyltransferase [Nanoarchaeota archaeon]|nr:GNAT family N-acetyltransferase [Nanoarchaeota archaeon]